ncbi:MAG TPA: trypsin-like peptidase domain-containing protein [Candidatus Paceibacterota bacterium]|nr:trypsin-like peptidase domain-containing protein [Candidatus Paceibacterota bacterium]
MDLEKLTKHQIVLLTLLVSFVTSIATGIVTVSLMDQAPAGVTRVVNQIVEHTVEKVVPATQSAAAITTTEKTVVVKDDDLAAQSIAKVQKSIARVVLPGGNVLVSRGIIIDAKGTVLADKAALAAANVRNFEVLLPDGTRASAKWRDPKATSTLATLDVNVGTSTGFAPATIADSSKLALGQSVIRIGGTGGDQVGTGVVASLPGGAAHSVDASISSATPGSLLMTLFGEVVGLSTTAAIQAGGSLYTTLSLPS